MPWLCPASKIVSSALLVCRLEVEVVIIFIPTQEFAFRRCVLRLGAVDPESRFQTNRGVRTGPLGQNDLVCRTCAGGWL
jgi:hypothetical protein